MIPNSAIPDAIAALDQKAGAPTGEAAQSKAGLQSEVAALTPRAARFAQNGAPDSADNSADNSTNESSATPSASADVLHPDTAAGLEKLGYDEATIAKLNLPQVKAIIQHQLPPRTASSPRPALPPDSPFAKPADPAAPVLIAEPNISDQQRSDLWEAYHATKTPSDFADVIAPFDVSDDLKHRLWTLKTQSAVPVVTSPVEKVTAAIEKMAALPTDVLENAERHPEVLRAMTSTKE